MSINHANVLCTESQEPAGSEGGLAEAFKRGFSLRRGFSSLRYSRVVESIII